MEEGRIGSATGGPAAFADVRGVAVGPDGRLYGVTVDELDVPYVVGLRIEHRQ